MNDKKYKIFIDGKEGTTGLEIYSRLENRDEIEVLTIDKKYRKDIHARLDKMQEADLAFLCLPDNSSKEIVDFINKGGVDIRIIDASTAHRTDFDFIYGLPELKVDEHARFDNLFKFRDVIKKSRRVANPGCFSTGFIMGIRPLITEGIMSELSTLVCHALTGYSGGGKTMIHEYENLYEDMKDILGDDIAPRQYGLSQSHKHIPEMLKFSKLIKDPIFAPIVCNFYRGMMVSIPISAEQLSLSDLPSGNLVEILLDIYNDYYKGEKLVKVREKGYNPENGFLRADAYAQLDEIEIMVQGNHDRAEIIVRYDNLGKGASGAAIQNMNIMLDIDELTGLKVL